MVGRKHHRAEHAKVIGKFGHLAAVAEQLPPSALRKADREALAQARRRKADFRARGLPPETDQLPVLAAAEALPCRKIECRFKRFVFPAAFSPQMILTPGTNETDALS